MNGIQTLDYVFIFGYLVVVVGMGIYLSRNQDTSDFFVARRSMPWILVSISIIASLFGAISFIATPGEAVKNGLSFSVMFLFTPFALLCIALVSCRSNLATRRANCSQFGHDAFRTPMTTKRKHNQ